MFINRSLLIVIFSMIIPIWASGASLTDDMQKLGQGEAYYLRFIKVYDATLYSVKPVPTQGILSSDVSKCLHLEYAVGISKKDFVKAADTVLRRQFSEKQLAQVSHQIDTLHQDYRDVTDGDSYMLCYKSESTQTTLALNGEVISVINSPVFAEMYFSIWLGDTDPLDDKLRDNLLANLLKN